MKALSVKQYFGDMQFYKKALLIGVPVMLQSLVQSLVSLIDSFMVSGLGDIKMSGVNISGQILFIFMVLQGAICTSGGIFLTQFSGAKKKEGMQQAFAFKVITSFALSFLYFLITMVFTREILSLMVIGNTQADLILDQGQEYMFLMGFIGVQSIVSYIIASSYREIGKVKAPLIISVVATLINTILNWGLIYGNLGMPRLDAQSICKGMLMLIAMLMPLWTYVNTQMAVFRAGGDTKVCMWVDGSATIVMIPMLFLMAAFTNWSPITIYLAVKLLDIGKILIAHFALKKERWVVNLSGT